MQRTPHSNRKPGPRYSEGARLAALFMLRKGWSTGDLERALGAPHGMVSRWLNGERRPGPVWSSKFEQVTRVPARKWGETAANELAPESAA
jgi:transcriptional regulator with XRE-family HTH domain